SFLAVGTLLIASGFSLGRPLSRPVADAIKAETQLESLVSESQPRWRSVLGYVVKRLRDLLKLSFFVTLISTPLVWHSFNVVTPIAILMNVLLAPLLLVALGSGIAAIFAASIGPAWAAVPGGLCGATLELMTWLIDVGASVPCGHYWLPSPHAGWVCVFYLGLLVWLLLRKGPVSPRRFVRYLILLIVWFVVAWIGAFGLYPRSEKYRLGEMTEAVFVDVGHGTAVVIRSGAETWLYDCGQLGNEEFRPRGIDQVLWSMGITRINGVFLSHADADHFNALPSLLERFSVDQVYTPSGMLEDEEPAVRVLAGVIERHGLAVKELSAGDEVRMGKGLSVTVLHPPIGERFDSDNAGSLVLQLSKAGRTILLPGDLEPPGTQQLLEHPRPSVGGILMAPHHGSLRANSEMVLQWARPRYVVISGGRLTDRAEVLQKFASTGAEVFRTAQDGAVRVRILESGDVEIRSYLKDPW
ncbi:MAG: MBL fold metallo-hydrolase, partial [Planctomycetota bacterium]